MSFTERDFVQFVVEQVNKFEKVTAEIENAVDKFHDNHCDVKVDNCHEEFRTAFKLFFGEEIAKRASLRRINLN